jgi:endo-1,4-beta-xylanase
MGLIAMTCSIPHSAHTLNFIAALVTVQIAAAAPSNAVRQHGKHNGGLNDLAQAAGLLYFGTAIDNPSLNNSEYMAIASNQHEFGQVTPANG